MERFVRNRSDCRRCLKEPPMRKVNLAHIILSIVILCVAQVEIDLGYENSDEEFHFHLKK